MAATIPSTHPSSLTSHLTFPPHFVSLFTLFSSLHLFPSWWMLSRHPPPRHSSVIHFSSSLIDLILLSPSSWSPLPSFPSLSPFPFPNAIGSLPLSHLSSPLSPSPLFLCLVLYPYLFRAPCDCRCLLCLSYVFLFTCFPSFLPISLSPSPVYFCFSYFAVFTNILFLIISHIHFLHFFSFHRCLFFIVVLFPIYLYSNVSFNSFIESVIFFNPVLVADPFRVYVLVLPTALTFPSVSRPFFPHFLLSPSTWSSFLQVSRCVKLSHSLFCPHTVCSPSSSPGSYRW